MTLTKRITELLQALSAGIPEREFCIQLGFLATLVGEPFYLYGRSGSGKSLVIDRLEAAFKNAKILKLGKREHELPEKIEGYDLIIFQSFDPFNEQNKNNVHIALDYRHKASLVISGDLRPEVALNRTEITDKISLIVTLPESISAGALCSLLQTQGDVTKTYVPVGLAVSPEEKAQWNEEIKKISLSEDTLFIIGEIAKICDENKIYVPIRKWLALSNIIKAAAFFNGRTETRITDTFFLGSPIWGRSTSNTVIVDSYKIIVRDRILKDIPNIIANPYDADDLLNRVHRILDTSDNKYDTKDFNGEPCVLYKINIAGEPAPLYVPSRYIETEQDFNPYNELRQEEKRVRCNFHGTSNCTISIDSAVKTIGLRTNMARGTQSSQLKPKGKFEDFGTLPTYILKENDPEVIESKKSQLADIRQEIKDAAENETRNLQKLRDVFGDIKASKDDLFCNKEFFKKSQEQVSELFDKTKVVISKIKEAHELIAGQNKY
jgi:MoxR-like ATPase